LSKEKGQTMVNKILQRKQDGCKLRCSFGLFLFIYV